MNNAIILLSGGLDSVVSLSYVKNQYDKILALTFDYGQLAFSKEKKSSEEICKFYNIEHRIVNIDWLGQISSSALNKKDSLPELDISDLDNTDKTNKSAKSVWVPNRNGLFVNIAASYAEALNYDEIIIGANKEEAATFKDNSADFINAVNLSLKNSCNKQVNVKAPLINMSKNEIISEALKLNIPFHLINSCYSSEDKHCGKCESCIRLKRALKFNNRDDIINKIFN
jgi:7-cyano-7-deazaguanine synthase